VDAVTPRCCRLQLGVSLTGNRRLLLHLARHPERGNAHVLSAHSNIRAVQRGIGHLDSVADRDDGDAVGSDQDWAAPSISRRPTTPGFSTSASRAATPCTPGSRTNTVTPPPSCLLIGCSACGT